MARSIAWGERHGDRRLVATEHANLGDLAFQTGDDREAGAQYAAALDGFVKMGRLSELPFLLPGIAALAARAGDDQTCATLLGASDAVAQTPAVQEPGDPAEIWMSTIREAEARSGPSFGQWRRDDPALGTEQAISLAMDVARRAATRDIPER